MMHFTHTGPLAGLTYCEEKRNAHDTYMHPNATSYQPPKDTTCPICAAFWDAATDACPVTLENAALWASLEDRQEWFAQALLDFSGMENMTADELCDRLNSLLMNEEA